MGIILCIMLLARMMSEFSKEAITEKARKITSDLLSMPYYKNYAAASGAVHNISNHEDAVSSTKWTCSINCNHQ